MVKKPLRVGSARLREVLASGRLARTRLFSAKALPAASFGTAVVVPKRAVASAAARNRVKRRCREAFRAAGAAPAATVVVTARPEAAEAPYPTLVAEAAEILKCYSKPI